MRAGQLRFALAAGLLLLTALSPISTQLAPQWESEVTIAVPAVTTAGEGVLSRFTVRVVRPGTGKVYFSADPLTQLDTQSAARTAALVACSLLGVSPDEFDFYVSMESDSMVVGGPSAGAAMTVAMVAAMANLTLDRSVVMTGMVNPDGTVGPVGGIPAKLTAAAAGGARLFLIPAGQEVVIESRIVEEPGPFWITRRVVRERVNVTELGLSLGVSVKPVMTIREAVEAFTGWRIPLEEVEGISLDPDVAEVISKWMDAYLAEYDASKAAVASNLSRAPAGPVKEYVKERVKAADLEARKARELDSEGRPYSAASAAFRSAVAINTARLVLEMALAEDPAKRLLAYAVVVNRSIRETEGLLEATEPSSSTSFEALVAAWQRLYDATEAFEKATEFFKSGDLISSAEWLVYAHWRAKTAESWAMLCLPGGPPPDRGVILSVAATMLYEAESVVGYAASLLEDVGESSSLLDHAMNKLALAKTAERDGEHFAVIGLSAEAIAYSTIAIHGAFQTVDPAELVDAVSRETLGRLAKVVESGARPVTALSYLEAAEVAREEGDLPSALLFYELSATYASIDALVSLSGGTLPPVETQPPSPVQPQVTPQPSQSGQGLPITVALAASLVSAAVGAVAGFTLGRRSRRTERVPDST